MRQNVLCSNDNGFSVIELKKLYLETLEELHRFSQMSPGANFDDDEIDRAEEALMDLEAHLLGEAAHIPLHTDGDVSALMDIWTKACASKDEDESVRQSDNIAMNLFRHLRR